MSENVNIEYEATISKPINTFKHVKNAKNESKTEIMK